MCVWVNATNIGLELGFIATNSGLRPSPLFVRVLDSESSRKTTPEKFEKHRASFKSALRMHTRKINTNLVTHASVFRLCEVCVLEQMDNTNSVLTFCTCSVSNSGLGMAMLSIVSHMSTSI